MASNPFASRYLQPGQMPYFVASESIDSANATSKLYNLIIAEILAASPKRFAIVGPHGTGKSTLLCNLISHLQQHRNCHLVRLTASNACPDSLWKCCRLLDHQSILAIDGFEQLRTWNRLFLRYIQFRKKSVLLITAHRKLAQFRTVYETVSSPVIDELVVEALLAGRSQKAEELFCSRTWIDAKKNHGSNLRECLFDAYDWFESHNEIDRVTSENH